MNGITKQEEQLLAPDRPALNESAIKDFALRCSRTYRAGKFTRVGGDFMDEVNTDIECLLREIRAKWGNTVHPALAQGGLIISPKDQTVEDNVFIVKGAFLSKLETEVNRAICRLIQNKVQKQPSCGCTLGRTR